MFIHMLTIGSVCRRLHPAIYVLALGYRTLDLEDAKRKKYMIMNILQRPLARILSWCKKLVQQGHYFCIDGCKCFCQLAFWHMKRLHFISKHQLLFALFPVNQGPRKLSQGQLCKFPHLMACSILAEIYFGLLLKDSCVEYGAGDRNLIQKTSLGFSYVGFFTQVLDLVECLPLKDQGNNYFIYCILLGCYKRLDVSHFVQQLGMSS